MKRISMLSLAIALVAGLTGVGATAASAATSGGVFADEYPYTVAGESSWHNHEVAFPPSGEFGVAQCTAPVLESKEMQAPTNQLSLTGNYGSCTGSREMRLDSCELIFRVGPGGNDTVEIGGNPECGPVQITAGNNFCRFEIARQSGLDADIQPAVINGTEYLNLSMEVEGELDYTSYGGIQACHNGTAYQDGSWTGSWLVEASNAGGTIENIRLAGLSVTGSSEYKLEPPRLAAPSYPVAIGGYQSATAPLVFGFKDGFTVECDNADFDGGSIHSATASALLEAAYSGCIGGALTSGIDMGSCAYQLDVLNVGPPYEGDIGIECGEPGDRIEVKAGTCRFDIEPQQVAGSVSLANSEVPGEVDATIALEEIDYVATDGFLCPLNGGGEFSDGTLGGTMKLSLAW